MPITDTQAEWLERFLERVEEHHDVLRGDREQKFVQDQRARYEQYGTKMFLSPAQLKWLQDIESRFPTGAEETPDHESPTDEEGPPPVPEDERY